MNFFKNKIRFSLLFMALLSVCAFKVDQGAKVKVYKIDQLVKRLQNADTTFVVNFWATWCKPCVAELPEFEKLSNDSLATKVKVLLVSMDFKEDLNSKLIPFLNKNKMKAEVVLLDETDATSFIPKLDDRWSGALPATLVKKGDKKVFAEKKLSETALLDLIRQAGQK